VGVLDDGDLQRGGAAVFWFKKVRTSMLLVFILSILVNIGMWFERFVIVVTSLHREFIPANWGYYSPTWVDICNTWDVRIVLHVLPVVPALHSADCHCGSQGRDAASRPASSAGRRKNWRGH
jgi:hypothetical protein